MQYFHQYFQQLDLPVEKGVLLDISDRWIPSYLLSMPAKILVGGFVNNCPKDLHLHEVHAFSLHKGDHSACRSVTDEASSVVETDVIALLDDVAQAQDRTIHRQVGELDLHRITIQFNIELDLLPKNHLVTAGSDATQAVFAVGKFVLEL